MRTGYAPSRTRERARPRRANGVLHPNDEWEEHHLFLLHVDEQILLQSLEVPLDGVQLRWVLAVGGADLDEQRVEPRQLVPREDVMPVHDVGNHLCQRRVSQALRRVVCRLLPACFSERAQDFIAATPAEAQAAASVRAPPQQ
jgi:hypothetical protein